MRRAGQAALRYLHAADEHENVTVLIPVNLANRCFVTHGSTCRLRWTGYKSGGTAAEKVPPNSALMLLPQAFHIARSGSMQAIEPCVITPEGFRAPRNGRMRRRRRSDRIIR
jgi:hypothetical protein